MIPQPHIIVFFGAGLVVLGSAIAAFGGYRQHKQQIDFERTTRIQLEETIGSVMGGDSYCYVNLQVGGGGEKGWWMADPSVDCSGNYSMYDVSVRLYDPDVYANLEHSLSLQEIQERDIFLSVGNIRSGASVTIPQTHPLDLRERDKKVLRADISARNGFFKEEFLLRKVGDHWLRALRVFKGFSNDLIYEWADQDFPRDNNGKLLWND